MTNNESRNQEITNSNPLTGGRKSTMEVELR